MKQKLRVCIIAMLLVINSLYVIKAINMHNNRIELILNIQSLLESEWEKEYGEKPNVSYESDFKGIKIIYEAQNGNEKEEYDLKNSSYYMFCFLIIINLIILLIVFCRKFNIRFIPYLKNREK